MPTYPAPTGDPVIDGIICEVRKARAEQAELQQLRAEKAGSGSLSDRVGRVLVQAFGTMEKAQPVPAAVKAAAQKHHIAPAALLAALREIASEDKR